MVMHIHNTIKIVLLLGLLFSVGCEQASKPVSKTRHTAVATYDADISDNGAFALVASVNHDAGYWDLEANALLYNWSHSEQKDVGIIAVDISPDGTRAVTSTEDNMAVWDTGNGKNLGFYSLPESDLRDIAISDRGDYLVMGLGDGRVIHLDLRSGRRLEFLAHGEAINSLDISPNGRYVLSGGNDYRAIFWDSKTGQPLLQLKHDSRVTLVALSRDGRMAFSSGIKADAHIWDIRSGKEISQLNLKERQFVLSCARFSADNQYLLTGAPTQKLVLWNTNNGKITKSIRVSARYPNRASGAIIYSVGFAPNGDLLSESSAGFGERWSVNSNTPNP